MVKKPVLIVIAGPNGSGKTSITSKILKHEWVAARVLKGGHDVPISKIISRYGKSMENAVDVAKIADRAYFYDNSENEKEAKLLFRLSEGKIYKKYFSLKYYTWANPIFDFFSEQ
jgi:predicted ABC-type ATPase